MFEEVGVILAVDLLLVFLLLSTFRLTVELTTLLTDVLSAFLFCTELLVSGD